MPVCRAVIRFEEPRGRVVGYTVRLIIVATRSPLCFARVSITRSLGAFVCAMTLATSFSSNPEFAAFSSLMRQIKPDIVRERVVYQGFCGGRNRVSVQSIGVPIRSRLPSGSRSSISRAQGASSGVTPNSAAMASTSWTYR